MKRFGIGSLSSLVIVVLTFQLFQSCTPTKTESTLLADRTVCSEEDCPSPQSTISGSLMMAPEAGSYQMNVDQSDIIEIAGKCSDLGIRQNRIIVHAFEGEDTSATPYLDNETSVNCINSSVPANNNARCLWITDGRGIIDSGTEYPQCFNGRFSFKVKLGKILRTNPTGVVDDVNNPRLKYLIRFKIRTQDGAITDSAWNSAVVERGITKPTFTQTPDLAGFNCKIGVNASKNLSALTDVSYSANLVREFPIGGDYTTEPIFPYASAPVSPPGAYAWGALFNLNYASPAGWSVSDFSLANKDNNTGNLPSVVIPGVKHKIKVTAYDRKYSYTLAPLAVPTSAFGLTTEEATSEELECGNQPAMISGNVVNQGTPLTSCADTINNFCNVSVSFPSVTGSGYIQFVAVKNRTVFEDTFDTTGFPVCGAALGSSTVEGCVENIAYAGDTSFTFKAREYPKNTCATLSGNYGIAARFVSNDVTPYKGAWSQVAPCQITSGF